MPRLKDSFPDQVSLEEANKIARQQAAEQREAEGEAQQLIAKATGGVFGALKGRRRQKMLRGLTSLAKQGE